MVWGFFPVESLPGEQSYYLFSKGTYKVGRKGCDVIINTDKGVSRVHAEVIIDSMTSLDPLQRRTTSFASNVRIKDLSKYGTFINKKTGVKSKVSEYPNKEAPLKDGDLLSFGTGNATYRFSYVPLIFFVQCSTENLMEDISLIGARATHSWSAECTHVLVEESTPITEDLVDAIASQKPVILKSWLKVVAEKNIRTELPSCDNYVPTLKLEGLPVKMVVPKLRENCLADYIFLLGSLQLYKFGDKLQSLLGAGGAKVLSVDNFCSSSEMSEDRANIRLVLVNPPVQANHFDNMKQLRSTSRINETSLISAVLSGHLDQSIMESPPIMISSSCSTDETIVEDSDVEMDAVSSHPSAQSIKLEEETLKDIEEEHVIEAEHIESEKVETMSSKVDDSGMVGKTVNVNKSETQSDDSSDVIYCQNLIVRDSNAVAPVHSNSRNKGVVNFKCFRKRDTPSGNSFKNLVPFARDPYRESECENDEVAEHVREEKKRKQLEAMAEDLFNNDKSKRSKAGGTSLRGILSRG